MSRIGVFISSVQREFADERRAICDHLTHDPLMRRFFDPFLFEDLPASDRRPEDVYLDEVRGSEIYVGLFGREYGSADAGGPSPTEQEFDCATEVRSHRLIFIRAATGEERDPRMRALIDKAQAELVRKRFATPDELLEGLRSALVDYLERKGLLRAGPFDASTCEASLDDLDEENLRSFLHTARNARQLPLPANAPPGDVLEHLGLKKSEGLTNAAVLLFGKDPQRFFISSEVRCAHFHGTVVAKPMRSHQVYRGTVFNMVDRAVDFVLAGIARSVGTRAESTQAPVRYEIPPEVVTEAIVNAVAHRDYTENGSVQVMLFSDRLEVWNPGRLPPPLTPAKLRGPHRSIPANPLLADGLYLTKYIERIGTGTVDMIERCRQAGLPEPEFDVTDEFIVRIYRQAAEPGDRVANRSEGEAETGGSAAAGEKPEQYAVRLLGAIDEAEDSFVTLTIRSLVELYKLRPDLVRAVVSSYDHAASTLPYEGDVLSLAAALGAMRIVNRDLYEKAARDELSFREAASFLKLPEWDVPARVAKRLEEPWRLLTEGGVEGAGPVDRMDANVRYYVSGSVPRFGMAPLVFPTMCGAIDQSFRLRATS